MLVRFIVAHLTLATFTIPFAWAQRDDSFQPKARQVVLMVWDGMRPDFITPEAAPTLHALAQQGTLFANHHSVYITSTEVNGAALATGCYPARNGILANREYRPEVDPLKPFATGDPAPMQVSDGLRGGRYLRMPTVAERVQQAGHRTAVAGTKPVALLHDRQREREASHGSTVIFAGKSYPESVAMEFAAKFGDFPAYPPAGTLAPNTGQNAWTTRAVVEELWKDGVPKFTTIWLGDPDFSQHLTQAGAPIALAAIRNSDDNLAAILAALDAKGARETTDIFIVSDHGFSTVDRGVDLTAIFKAGGFATVREYAQVPAPGEVLIITLGGSVQLYVPGHDAALIGRLVEFLQTQDFAGPIFTRDALPGTFPLREVRLDSPDAGIVFAFRWSEAANRYGVAGNLVTETRKPGFGTHASLSRYDVHNTLVAAGPDIRAGFVDALPTANVDVAPTILRLLGIRCEEPLDGRVLEEALAAVTWEAPAPRTKIVEAATEGTAWRSYLKFTELGRHVYLDEGNFGAPPAR